MPSLPVMASVNASKDKELEELAASLEKERAAHKTIIGEKAALEAELESLSQALFEEVNYLLDLSYSSLMIMTAGKQDGCNRKNQTG